MKCVKVESYVVEADTDRPSPLSYYFQNYYAFLKTIMSIYKICKDEVLLVHAMNAYGKNLSTSPLILQLSTRLKCMVNFKILSF
jgi:hypothetical protein